MKPDWVTWVEWPQDATTVVSLDVHNHLFETTKTKDFKGSICNEQVSVSLLYELWCFGCKKSTDITFIFITYNLILVQNILF